MAKKVLVLALAVCLALCSVCAPALAEYDPDKNYTLSFYYWDESQKPGMDAMIELFEAQYPNIKVESTIIPWMQYWTKLQTSLPSGTGPDLFWMSDNKEYIRNGLLYDMTDRIEADGIDMSKFPASVLKLYTENGRYYGIPKDFDTIAICYNKAIFDECGVPYPTSDWTWDEFRATCKAVTRNNHYGFYATTSTQSLLSHFIYANGAAYTNEEQTISTCNDPKFVEALQFLHDLIYVDKSSPSGAEQTEMAQGDMFITGMVAMVPGGSWTVKSYYEGLGDDLGVVEFPSKLTKGNVSHGLAYCASPLSPNIDAAWEFLKFAATYEAQAATAGAVIPAYEGAAQRWIDAYPTLDLEGTYIKALEYAKTDAEYPRNAEQCNIIFNETISTIWLDENPDIQAMMDDCQIKIQAMMDAE